MTLLHQAAQKAAEALNHAQQWIGSAPHGDNCYVSDHYEGDPGDCCNCGKESALSSVECALSALQQQPEPVALTRFNECGGMEEQNPLERLRFFCALAMKPQDWMDVEQFFAALQQQEVPREPPESELVCYEAYAALGMFLMELAEGGHPQAEKLLDNLSQARLAHKDVLPFSPSTTQQQEAGNGPVIGSSGSDWIAAGGFRFHEHAGWQQVAAEYANNSDVTTLYRKRCDRAAAPSTPESAEKDDAGGGKGGS